MKALKLFLVFLISFCVIFFLLEICVSDNYHESEQTEETGKQDSDKSMATTNKWAKQFLISANEILKSPNLSFAEIDSLYMVYENNLVAINNADRENNEGMFCKLISDYHNVSLAIQAKDINKIKNLQQNTKLNPIHQKAFKELAENTEILNNNPKRFSDLKKSSKPQRQNNTEKQQHTTPTFSCEYCNMAFQTQQELQTHKEVIHFVCPHCGRRYRNSEQLGIHFYDDHQ